MNASPDREKTEEVLMTFVRERFLDGDPDGELEPTSPLIDWGLLTSLNSAVLLNFLHREFEGSVAVERITAKDLRDVRSIAALLCDTPVDRT
ncbi:acyl carrier protein [Nocardiopsis changdeensis]|uniref:acyl carrier protein n=1 Tax=Nocardiopsis changdeensis TaxID=2831969 RepID=UPI003F44C563